MLANGRGPLKKGKNSTKRHAADNGNYPGQRKPLSQASDERTYSIPDYRLEKPNFMVRQVRKGDDVEYEVSGNLNAPVPPIRDSKYLNKQQAIEIYRYMLANRKMEVRWRIFTSKAKLSAEFILV